MTRRVGAARIRIVGIGTVVAVVLAVVLVAVSGRHGHDGASSARSRSPRVAPDAYVGDVGDVTDPSALRRVLDRPSVTAATRAGTATVDGARLHGTAATALRCAATLETGSATRGADPVVLLATATFHDRSAVVAALHRGARTIAFVMDRDDCSVLVSQSH